MFGALRLPAKIRFGSGEAIGAAQDILDLGRRVLVVADPFLATTAPFRSLVESLEHLDAVVEVITDVPPELPVHAVESTGNRARDFAPEVVVGYGGGSALDAAKLVAVLVAHGGPLAQYYGENAVPGPVAPLVAIPTTAGTGSEVTPVAVVSDPNRELKVGVSSPHIIPRAAIVDPVLTLAAPRTVTVHSGIDALVHAIESFTAAPLAHNDLSEAPVFVGRNVLAEPLALEASALIYRNLPNVVATPDDSDARAAMARGSLLAGMAFGSTGTHLSHAMQYALGAMTQTPHGLGTGALLPYVMQAIRPVAADRLARLGHAMGIVDDRAILHADAASQVVIDGVASLCADVGLPVALSDIGFEPADVPRAVELTMRVERLIRLSPLPVSEDTITRILEAAATGDRARLDSNVA